MWRNDFKSVIFILGIGILSSCQMAFRWFPQYFTDDMLALVQAMAWCHQATSHYLNQCWQGYVLPYGVTRPQWVNSVTDLTLHLWSLNVLTSVWNLTSVRYSTPWLQSEIWLQSDTARRPRCMVPFDITGPHWVNSSRPSDSYRHQNSSRPSDSYRHQLTSHHWFK